MMPKVSPEMIEIEGQFYAKNHPKAIAHRKAKPVAGLRTQESESNERREGEDCRMEEGESGVLYRVVFTVYRRRPLDEGDNSPSSLKAVRDAVAEFLGFRDDNNPRLEWHYHQIQSKRDSGTHILIESETAPMRR